MVRPRARAGAARTRRWDGLAALERPGRITVRWASVRAVDVLQLEMVDREVQAVELVEDAGQLARGASVDDQLPGVAVMVESDVGDGQDAQLGESDGATLVPGAALLDLR